MNIRLTQTVQKGGCAAKISAEVLRETLGGLNFTTSDPNVLVDGSHFDDAGIYKVAPGIALVQTLDFFTPILDSPHLFGAVAATNALSDVYAMGGQPKTAMAILAFPLATLDPLIMREVLSGALEKVKEAGATLIGGHSIDDDTLKFGLSVTGLVNPEKMWTNQGAENGDVLILTKGLGTGTLTAGLKNSDYTESTIQEAIDSMLLLNDVHSLLSPKQLDQIHAATDITGFGFLGHSMQMAKASNKTIAFQFSQIPVLSLAYESLKADNLTKAHASNARYTAPETAWKANLSEVEKQILFDPQTSGGLLLSVHPAEAASIVKQLKAKFPLTAVVGTVQNFHDKRIEVHA